MKISVIFTGGTIGSKTNGGEISLSDAPYVLLEGADSDISFECFEPYNILSEELTGSELKQLANCVRERLASDCDGVIVTHGTDSLVYTAAFLGLIFADTPVPIVLVSSGYPLDDKRANGRQNFEAAAELIKQGRRGVFAVWYADGKLTVHKGVNLLRQQPYSDMLVSLDESGNECAETPMHCPENFDGFGKVLYLTAQPSMVYPSVEGISAVLILSYHSGTLCADKRFADFMSRAKQADVPVFIAGAGGRDADYETVEKYRSLGAAALPKASPDVMYIKLCIAASLAGGSENIRRIMLT